MFREVTIGRSKNCDIYMGEQCSFVSNNHALVFMDNGQLYYRDYSTNGTYINNVFVHGNTVPIRFGDNILLAGRYPLNWNALRVYFPNIQSHASTMLDPNILRHNNVSSGHIQKAVEQEEKKSADTTKWNWGAFVLYPIWGFFNGCWWAFFIGLVLWWSLIPNIVFGINGSKWAWKYKTWDSIEDFESSQDSWNTVGKILFAISLFFVFIAFIVWFAIGASFYSYL